MDQRAAVIYLSTNGNTKRVAKAIASQMSAWIDVQVLSVRDVEKAPEVLRDVSLVGFGGPVFHLRLAERLMEVVRSEFHKGAHGAPDFFMYCTYAGISSGLALLSPARYLRRAGYSILAALKVKAPHFYESDVVFPDDHALSIIRQFANLLKLRLETRPAQRTLLHRLNYQRPAVKLLHKVVPVISNRRVPRIEVHPEACRECGVCVKGCPTAAITLEDGQPVINTRACMHCYHCAKACRTHALTFDEDRLREIVSFNKRVLGEEQPASAVI